MSLDWHSDLKLAIRAPYRLQWEKAQEAFVLLYPEGMIQLNHSAGKILEFCCLKEQDLQTALHDLSQYFGIDHATIENDTIEFLKAAYDQQWLESKQ